MFCETNAPLEKRMPNESTSIEFFHWEKTQKCPFVVYADLEAINVASTVLATATHSRTREVERQYPAGYGAVLVDSRRKLSFPPSSNCVLSIVEESVSFVN